MKKHLRTILIILLFVCFLVGVLIAGLNDLLDKTNIHTVKIDLAVNVMEQEHSIGGVIPTRTDYYYVGIKQETKEAYLIKGTKDWFTKNFDSKHVAYDKNGVQITGQIKIISNSEIARELESRAWEFTEVSYPIGTRACINLGYKEKAKLKILIVALSIYLTISGIFLFYGERRANTSLTKITFWIVIFGILVVLIGKVFI